MSEVVLSIITPFHNVDMELFERTERSVLSALLPDWEWIIVLHNTTTIAPEAMRARFREHPNVRIIEKHDRVSNPCSPRNTGLENAAGKYVYFLDDDDEANGAFLLEAVNKMEKEGIDVVIGRAESQADTEEVFVVPLPLDFPAEEAGYMVPRDADSMGRLLYGAPIMLACKVIRRDLIAENGIRFDEDILLTEDVLFSLECFLKAKTICVLGNTTAYTYVQHGDSLLQSMMSKKGFTAEDYLKPVRKIVSLALQNHVSPGGYIWSMLGMFGAVAGNADIEEDKKKLLMTQIQQYIPYVKPEQMKSHKTYVSRELETDTRIVKEEAEERICVLIREYNACAQLRVSLRSIGIFCKDISHLSPDQARGFVDGFRKVLEKEDAYFSAAVFVMPGGTSVVLLRVNLTLAKAVGMDRFIQAMIGPMEGTE